MDEPNTLKEALFNPHSIAAFGAAIHAAHSPFETDTFLTRVLDDAWEGRELKERMRHVTTVLNGLLPSDYHTALAILKRASAVFSGGGFISMVFSDYVAVYGLDHPEESLWALELFTQQVSAEFAIRPFINRYPHQVMAQMLTWADHESADVRRLASEGCRPRLPWGIGLPALQDDSTPILPILEKLKHDESESVRRSVANNLNDISKDHPKVVIEVLRRWQADNAEAVSQLAGHALRTLVKAGHPDALELLGYASSPAIAVRNVTVEPATIPMGGSITLSFDIESLSDEPQNLMIDYVLHAMKANGQLAAKVWKLSKRTIEPGEMIHVTKTHSFQAVTTRKHYPGLHALEPQVNGQVYARVEFMLGEP